MSNLGIIPVRENSKRLPGKTFVKCAGKPLIEWTIEACKGSKAIDDFVVVSACKKVKAWCGTNNIKFISRPKGLEGDRAPILDTINWLNDTTFIRGFANQVLLQVTNPTRTAEDIDCSLDMLSLSSVNSVCSVIDVGEFHPSRMFRPTLGNGIIPITFYSSNQWDRTQDLGKVYMRDGSIYAWRTKTFEQFGGITLLPQRIVRYEIESFRSVRVDTVRDLVIAEKLLT